MSYRTLLTTLCVPALVLLVAACGPLGDPSQAIPVTTIAAKAQQAQRLVVVLPGRGDDLDALRDSGMVEAIQNTWPDAEVVLAELAIRYYMDGAAPRRLHEEVIAPARRRGYREIWLAGASLGGMGVLLHDRAYPGTVDGMILLAPFLGERAILKDIREAGGVRQWQAGPAQTINADNWQHELWRHVQGWSREPERARNVWLAYGDRDRLRSAMPLLTPALDENKVLLRNGGHSWSVWAPATAEILRRVEAQRAP